MRYVKINRLKCTLVVVRLQLSNRRQKVYKTVLYFDFLYLQHIKIILTYFNGGTETRSDTKSSEILLDSNVYSDTTLFQRVPPVNNINHS